MKNSSSVCSNEKTKNKLDIVQSKFSTSVTNYGFEVNVFEVNDPTCRTDCVIVYDSKDEFQIDKKRLRAEIGLPKNKPKKERYLKNVDRPFRLKIIEIWHKEMMDQKKNIFFFDCYENSQIRHFEEFFKPDPQKEKEMQSGDDKITMVKRFLKIRRMLVEKMWTPLIHLFSLKTRRWTPLIHLLSPKTRRMIVETIWNPFTHLLSPSK
jgi:hypothetical protein